MRISVRGFVAVTILALGAVLPMTASAGERVAIEKKPGLTNRVVVVINNIPGSHYVTVANQFRVLPREGSIAIFLLPTGGYPMLQLDGGHMGFYHLGSSAVPDFQIIWTTWCTYGPF